MPSARSVPEGVRVRMDEQEAALLRGLVHEMRLLLDDAERDDPVLERLFPDAYDDAEQADGYRDLVGADLEQLKLDGLNTVAATLGDDGPLDVVIGEEQADRWLAVITDMRLAIGVRLDVDEQKMEAELDHSDPNTPAMAALHWLGWLQETIIRELSQSDGEHG